MATCEIHLTVKTRWWVKPYVWLARAFLASVAWAMDEDDPRIPAFIEAQAAFVARYGIKVVAS